MVWCRSLQIKNQKSKIKNTAPLLLAIALLPACTATTPSAHDAHVWTTSGFDAFSQGNFDAGGANLYVSHRGRLQMINVWDVNNDGHIDLFFGQSHDLIEYQPALIYYQRDGEPCPQSVNPLPSLHSSTQCVTDLNGDGYTDVVMLNHMFTPEPMFRSYIYWGGPEGLSPKYRIGLPTFTARNVFAADLNSDGLKELIVLNAARHRFDLSGGCISIHWQTESGIFPPDRRDDIPVPSLGAADMADIDGNGFGDLVFHGRPSKDSLTPAAVPVLELIGSSEEANNVFLLAGKDGGFEPMQPLAITGERNGTPQLLSLDGKKYLAMLTAKTIDLYPFDGLQLQPPSQIELPGVNRIAAADVNVDGHDDIICQTPGKIHCLWGSGEAHAPDRAWTVEVNVSNIAVGDVTSDGRPDIVAAVRTDGNNLTALSRVYINSETGLDKDRFVALQTSGASEAHIADLDHDGENDVIFACSMGGYNSLDPPVRVYLGSADGTYQYGNHYDLPGVSAFAACMADYNDDGFTDLFVANQYEGMNLKAKDAKSPIYWGDANGLSADRAFRFATEHCYIPATADINRDGYLDIVIGGVENTDTYVYWGGADGYTRERRQPIKLGGIDGTHLADVNKDGWLDLVIVAIQNDATFILLGDKNGYDVERRITLPMPIGGAGVDMADLDGNGWLDLVLTGWSAPRKGFAATKVPSYIWWGSADGFAANRRTEIGTMLGATHDVAIADLNKDGHLDFVCSTYRRGESRVFDSFIFWGNAQSAYSIHDVTKLRQASALGIQVADLNHDGWPDICFNNHNDGGNHRVNSRIHWNRQGKFTEDDVTLLPTQGAHMSIAVDLGNAYTRELAESYISTAFEKPAHRRFGKLHWQAHNRFGTSVVFQVRTAATQAQLTDATWTGPKGPDSYFTKSGASLAMLAPDNNWIQYRATLRTPNGAATPILTRVDVVY